MAPCAEGSAIKGMLPSWCRRGLGPLLYIFHSLGGFHVIPFLLPGYSSQLSAGSSEGWHSFPLLSPSLPWLYHWSCTIGKFSCISNLNLCCYSFIPHSSTRVGSVLGFQRPPWPAGGLPHHVISFLLPLGEAPASHSPPTQRLSPDSTPLPTKKPALNHQLRINTFLVASHSTQGRLPTVPES